MFIFLQVSIPCKKRSFRLYGKEGYPLLDIMSGENEPPPEVGERILCRHPFNESKRAYVVPQRVEELMKCYWTGNTGKKVVFSHLKKTWIDTLVCVCMCADKKREELPTLKENRERCIRQLERMRPDHMRKLNPTPYKVNLTTFSIYIYMYL